MRLAIRAAQKRKSIMRVAAAQDLVEGVFRAGRQESVAVLESSLVLPKENLPMVNENPPQGASGPEGVLVADSPQARHAMGLPFAVGRLSRTNMHTPNVAPWSKRPETAVLSDGKRHLAIM